MLGSYLYKYTIGRLGLFIGLPLFILAYIYIAGLTLVFLKEGFTAFSTELFYSPLYIWHFFSDQWIILIKDSSTASIGHIGPLILASIVPLFIFRLLRAPFMVLLWLLSLLIPTSTKEQAKQEEDIEKERLRKEILLRREIEEELKQEENK